MNEHVFVYFFLLFFFLSSASVCSSLHSLLLFYAFTQQRVKVKNDEITEREETSIKAEHKPQTTLNDFYRLFLIFLLFFLLFHNNHRRGPKVC